MEAAKLNIAIVGCGKIADGHAEEIKNLPAANLAAACDIEPIMAEQLAARYRIPRHYSDLETMLANEHIDVLHVTTPPASHLPITLNAVAAGCHVLVEKPLAPTAEQAHRLITAVEEAGKKLTVNYWPNFEQQSVALREHVIRGDLGDIVHLESYLGYNLAGAFGQALLSDPEHWVHRLPGKLFQNNLDHVLNKIVPLLPEGPTSVHAEAFRRRKDLRNDATDCVLDELRVLIRSGDATAYATFCAHAKPVGHFVRVYGTRATVDADFNMRTLVFEAEQTMPSALGRLFPPFRRGFAYLRQAGHNVREFGGSRFGFFAGMNRLFSLFYDSVLQDAPLPISYSEMLRVSELMDEIIQQVYPTVSGRSVLR